MAEERIRNKSFFGSPLSSLWGSASFLVDPSSSMGKIVVAVLFFLFFLGFNVPGRKREKKNFLRKEVNE